LQKKVCVEEDHGVTCFNFFAGGRMEFWFLNAGIGLNKPVQHERYDQNNAQDNTAQARQEEEGQQRNAEETTGLGEQGTCNSGMNAEASVDSEGVDSERRG
jgi:hypothetical protein